MRWWLFFGQTLIAYYPPHFNKQSMVDRHWGAFLEGINVKMVISHQGSSTSLVEIMVHHIGAHMASFSFYQHLLSLQLKKLPQSKQLFLCLFHFILKFAKLSLSREIIEDIVKIFVHRCQSRSSLSPRFASFVSKLLWLTDLDGNGACLRSSKTKAAHLISSKLPFFEK